MEHPRPVAALYIQAGGAYYGVDGVDPWDQKRDARQYVGPYPVVAHPPCERWGRYWYGGPSSKVRLRRGDDAGCFAAAINAVRAWGGVLEHPEASAAWRTFGLVAPPKSGGWFPAGDFMGWTCCVEQGHYGHRARKATWLYVVGTIPPPLKWGAFRSGIRLQAGYHSAEERKRAKGKRASQIGEVAYLTRAERAATPLPFRDLLIDMARSVYDARA